MPSGREINTETIFVIDAGTQSLRAGIVDLNGNILNFAKTAIEPYFSEHPGWAEQHPDYYWEQLCLTIGKVLEQAGPRKESIRAVTITSQRATIINVDENGSALRPAFTWLDQRKAQLENWPPKPLAWAMKSVGLFDEVAGLIRDCKSNWVRQNQPEIWEKTHKILQVSGFLTHRLTGRFVDTVGNNVGHLPVDRKTFGWAKDRDMVWKMFPMEREKLPDLLEPTRELGRVTKKAAGQTGLPQGLPVIAAAADKACEVLGAGCLTPETACLSYGTVATINVATAKYVKLFPLIPPYASAVPHAYYTEYWVTRGYWMVSWFKEEFGFYEQTKGREKDVSPESLFNDMIKDIPPGSMGLMLQPCWAPGPADGPEAKGSIIGFGDVHKRPHVYRAILEGLAFSLKKGLLRTQKKTRVPIQGLRVSGGGSQSEAAMQITADVFGLPAQRPHTFETSTVGAAMDAAVGLGYFSDFESAVGQMTRVRDQFDPIPQNQALYQDLFERVYCKMDRQMRPLLREILDITGYPAK